LQHHSDVTLCMGIFYVQGHPFFHTISRKVQFRTVPPVLKRNKVTLLREIKPVLAMYKSRGFNISDLHANMEFECIRNDVLPSRLNVTAADDHDGEVEQSIWTMKERARTTIHGLPFKRLPKVMIQALVYHAAKGLNQFPAKNGISDTLSPLTIMTGRSNPDYNDLKLEFGSYVQVFEDNTPSNTTTSRNTGAIVLNPTGNAQGDYFFMSLVTGKRLSRHQWNEIPMTNAVISAVKAMAEKEGLPLIKGGVPLFEWPPNASVEDFLEEDVESAEEYKNFTEDNFDPTVPDNDVVDEPDDYNDVEHFDDNDIGVPDDDDVGVPDDDEVDDPAVFEPDPDDFWPDELDPNADEGAEANDDPGDEDPGDNAPDTDVEPDADEDLGTNWYNLRSDRGIS